ncbi:thiosulfate sulfurtransferase RDL1 NDAI_0E00780 [Naumovozyma dairenensis CBS 421]|uniref:Rhodanese domain-containing protein n=1 Tax=Naumovozyma dairenensis (strain ATCC 10597 / BCRC 20456 / CBS 421 / NBRC 0211 / NRRL Y-12639) TaxID=1071378 RepID=G0WAX4_NAUDC|nr:hypothetical protein NDAI_0E00780 [Naumovozyma dairenensis CBS 421]CCD24894.1 hypothetical protein NDAI_0E00780 [Naumovozyma dairenensis CBS 421]
MWKRIVSAWNGSDEVDSPHHHSSTTTTSSSSEYKSPIYNFQQMKEIVYHPDPSVTLIDCREPSEFEVVRIPGSINIPFRTHPNAFILDDQEFKETFGVDKPSKDSELIFFCASGMRASKAQNVAVQCGYENTALYKGSMNDWVDNGGDQLQFH